MAQAASDAQNPIPFEVVPGVVVDPGRSAAYVMSPAGGIDAIDLDSGRLLWSTMRAAMPLVIAGGRVVAATLPCVSGAGLAAEPDEVGVADEVGVEAVPEACPLRNRDRQRHEGRRGRGRPRVEVNPNTVERLAAILCTVQEIAAVCGCSKDTLERNFAAVIKRGREAGKASLRRAQWKAAQKGNPTMLIWLGKQYLGQRDRPELTGPDADPRPTLEMLDWLMKESPSNGTSDRAAVQYDW